MEIVVDRNHSAEGSKTHGGAVRILDCVRVLMEIIECHGARISELESIEDILLSNLGDRC